MRPAVLIATFAGGIGMLAVATAGFIAPPGAGQFKDVYVAALLAGRDPDAAVRKARYRTDILVNDLGATRSQAAAEVSDSMVRHASRLCFGG